MSGKSGRPPDEFHRAFLVALDQRHRMHQQSRHLLVFRQHRLKAVLHSLIALVDLVEMCGHDDPIWIELMG